MPVIGSLRRLVLAPSLEKVSFAGRGFPVTPSDATERLEAVPRAVVCGFEWGIDARSQWELERRLALVDAEQRGFAYEGATMACSVLDAMGPRRGNRTRELLLGPGRPHIFLAYIGIGFAMARLPRVLWRKVAPDLPADGGYYPEMSWLAVDGYGFDLAYFRTRRWVDRQERPAPYPWEGDADYFPRAVDQGIGRALWFVHGGNPGDVAAAVRAFAPGRHADLWSGVGLAATFAGATGAAGFDALRREAGDHWPELAQGSVFAVKARHYSGFVPEHTAVAAERLAGLAVERAVHLADSTAVPASAAGTAPAYELWRRKVRDAVGTAPVTG
ncbi:DUF1702 family protein [Actinomadura logoneensis]|uniref:DUF1702 family protein n=1 Tax=Actinomadura logoneensis TaxID=2293572 RepID=UPI001F29C18B|nr:DUF1702 family protein [Actinomadura logoneensis]